MIRKSRIERITNETNIELTLNLDGKGMAKIDTGIGFFDHMLHLMGKHGFMDLEIDCRGDLEVDNHHTVEDVGIVMGKALKEALGDKKGIRRYANVYTPMDEALTMVSLDISGRPFLHFDATFQREYVGTLETELIEEFFRAFVNNSELTLHINVQYGKNAHHIIESIFKGFGRAIDQATTLEDRIDGVLSTKGSL